MEHITVPQSGTDGIPGARGARLTETKVPLDRELTTALRIYLSIRPDDSPNREQRPLFVSCQREYGERITTDAVHHIVEQHATNAGLYEKGAGAKQNLTPQTLYHFFKERYLGQPVVKDYILGNRDTLPMTFDKVVTDFREGCPSLVE